MISSYPPATRRQLLSKHFLISTMPEGALDDLVKFTTVARFEPHRVIFSKGDAGAIAFTGSRYRSRRHFRDCEALRALVGCA
jgi:hypothetical protein